jgi:hypothetical protein
MLKMCNQDWSVNAKVGMTAIDLVAKDQEGNTGQLVACQQALKGKRDASVYKTKERHT